MFTARAQPIPGARPGADDTAEQIEVEVRIAVKVHDAVRARAAEQDQRVAAIARAVLFQAAARVSEDKIRAYQRQRKIEITEAANKARAKAYDKARAEGLSPSEAQTAADAAATQAAEQAANRRLPLREYQGTDHWFRLRFVAPRAAYERARDAIVASGATVASAVEDGLKAYARTGHLNSK